MYGFGYVWFYGYAVLWFDRERSGRRQENRDTLRRVDCPRQFGNSPDFGEILEGVPVRDSKNLDMKAWPGSYDRGAVHMNSRTA